jgi:hypothetical protein
MEPFIHNVVPQNPTSNSHHFQPIVTQVKTIIRPLSPISISRMDPNVTVARQY